MIKPSIFVLGAQKCGTTALANMLGEHPLKKLVKHFISRELRSTIAQKILKSNLKEFSYSAMKDSAQEYLKNLFSADLARLEGLGFQVSVEWAKEKT